MHLSHRIDHTITLMVAHATATHVMMPGLVLPHLEQFGVIATRSRHHTGKEFLRKLVGGIIKSRRLIVNMGVGIAVAILLG